MKVLWLTLTSSCYVAHNNTNKSFYNGGGWISSAEQTMRDIDDVQLAVCFNMDGQPFKSIQNGICYYPFPSCHGRIWEKPLNLFEMLYYKDMRHEKKRWPFYFNQFRNIINDFQPDIIHVWGSESYLGLISMVTKIPVCLHIQGMLNPYENAFLPPFVSWKDIRGEWWQLTKRISTSMIRAGWNESSFRERQIIKSIKYHLGRTDWDYRVTKLYNHNAQYFTVNEILRNPFYNNVVERKLPSKLIIVSTISSPLYKGYDLILKTAKLIKENYNIDFEWKTFGNIDPIDIEKSIDICHKDVNVQLNGIATAEELIETELNATLYFHPSYIDNSPNSICEAQILGLPIVSTNVGGIPSIVIDNREGFLVPTNDPFQSAYHIISLFANKDLNLKMGENGKQRAKKRHDKQTIIDDILNVYHLMLNNESNIEKEHDKNIWQNPALT